MAILQRKLKEKILMPDGSEEHFFELKRPGDHKFKVEQIDGLINSMLRVASRKTGKNAGISYIKVINGGDYATYHTLEKFYEYYEGKVKDTTKFSEIARVHFAFKLT